MEGVGGQQTAPRKPERGGTPWTFPPTLSGRFGSSVLPAGVGYEGKERRNACSRPSDLLPRPRLALRSGDAFVQRLGEREGGASLTARPAVAGERNTESPVCLHVRHTKAGSAPGTTWQGALSRIPEAPYISGSPGSKDIRTIPCKNLTHRACIPRQGQQNE